MLDFANLIAIDVDTHAQHNCRQPIDPIQAQLWDAASVYGKRPTIAETIQYHRAEQREPILKGNAVKLLFGDRS